jgi:hypothetical protein
MASTNTTTNSPEGQKGATMAQSDSAVRYFETSSEAWAFMRECDERGISAGFPSLRPVEGKGYSVQYTEIRAPSCDSCGACDECGFGVWA